MNSSQLLLIDNCVVLLNELDAELKKTNNKFKSGTYPIEVFYLIGIMERFSKNVNSLRILIPEIVVDFSIEHSIGLILRNALHDSIHIFYIVAKNTNEESTEQVVINLCADQIKYSVSYLDFVSDNKLADESTIKKAAQGLLNNYPIYFKEGDYLKLRDRLNIRKSEIPSTTEMIKAILLIPYFNGLTKIYDMYQLYSKYEHFGIITHHIQRREKEIIMQNIIGSFEFILMGIIHTLFLLNDKNFDVEMKMDIEIYKELHIKFTKL